MRVSYTAGQLGMAAGVATWLLVTAIAFYIAIANGLYSDNVPAAAALALLNGAAMLYAGCHENSSSQTVLAAHGLQLVAALAMGYLLPISFVPIYTIIWIAMATSFYSQRTCWWLLGAVLLAWYGIERFEWENDSALINVTLYGTFHLFAMLSARNAAEAEAARGEAEALNRELVATQHLLSEASRQQERTRIARELHDLLGHHLTALSINLQIAERLSEGEVRAKVGESRALARLLLSDVRDAVDRLREDTALDVAGAIRLLATNVPQLEVHTEIEEGLVIDDIEVAESLLRCAQEALTNTLRHSGANESWIRIWRDGDDICLEVSDDGRVAGDLREGNGIMGMRERLAALQGSLRLDTVNDALRVNVRIHGAG